MKRTIILFGLLLSIAAPILAHVGVTPNQSKAGATETYTFRVPSEGGRTTTSVTLAVPEGVAIVSLALPAGITAIAYKEKESADKPAEITWTIEIKAGATVQLAVVAKNPTTGSAIVWKVVQRYTDGTSSSWSGPSGDRSPAPVTNLAP